MKTYLTILSIILGTSINAQFTNYYLPYKQNSSTRDDLKGSVKYMKLTEWRMIVKFGDPTKDRYEKILESFYRKDGNYEKETSIRGSSDGYKTTYDYSYNKKNQLQEIKTSPVQKVTASRTFVYNAQDQLIERNLYNKKGDLTGKDKYKYNTDGQLQSIHRYSGDGNPIGKKTFEWDEKSRLTDEYEYNEKDEPLVFEIYGYDAQGNTKYYDEVTTGNNNKVVRYTYDYTYNDKNQKIKTEYTIDGSFYEVAFTYDSNGNLIRKDRKAGKNGTFKLDEKYTYIYDSNGNWTSKLKEFENDLDEQTFILVEREIKYW